MWEIVSFFPVQVRPFIIKYTSIYQGTSETRLIIPKIIVLLKLFPEARAGKPALPSLQFGKFKAKTVEYLLT